MRLLMVCDCVRDVDKVMCDGMLMYGGEDVRM